MFKILTAEQIREADAFTISNEPIAGIDLMERAAIKCADWIINNLPEKQLFKIFCGNGNNGGDGLAISRLLSMNGSKVDVYVSDEEKNYSPYFKINYDRLHENKSIKIHTLTSEKYFPELNSNDCIIDALFGTGLNRKAEGLFASLIEHINRASGNVISIDIPSGLFADKSLVEGAVIKANHTLTFQFPKHSFLFPESGKYTGKLHILDIGIHKDYILKTPAVNFLLEKNDIANLRKNRNEFSHKGTFGHALILTGSYGKIGASVLSSKACIRSGAGLVTAFIPKCGYDIIQSAVPEIMVVTDESQDIITQLPDLSKFNSIGIGPGIGKSEATGRVIKMLIQNYTGPIVFDADAINLLSENKTWLAFIPQGCIFTPHPREFERLVGKWSDSFERQRLQLEFSKKFTCYVVLKDHYTCITSPDGKSYFNSTGNAGMATAGSGDVLTGMLTGLLAQGYSSRDAALMGVYLHGAAGDIAAGIISMEAMTATDIIESIGNAFQLLSK